METIIGVIEDVPIRTQGEDSFNRTKFVDTISEIVLNNTKHRHSCFAIGIYARWGEGKSSVLNMIREQLTEQTKLESSPMTTSLLLPSSFSWGLHGQLLLREKAEKFIVVDFNPWLFKDQESLLLDFFNTIQSENIDKKIIRALKKYGPLVSLGLAGMINIVGTPLISNAIYDKVQKFFKSLPDVDESVIKRREKINKLLQETNTHIVVLMDDVDRLDSEETHALFKLIKQTAGFANTTFVIAMDKDAVAHSLCTKFENGDIDSGYRFLQKIIQLHMYLPKIQKSDLEKYLNIKVKRILDVQKKETHEVTVHIKNYILPLVTTAREVISYTNLLSVSISLLYGKVNILDLCSIEFLKIICPRGYAIIKNNKRIVVQEFDFYEELTQMNKPKDEQSAERAKQWDDFINSIVDKCTDNSSIYHLKELVDNLLPRPSDNVRWQDYVDKMRLRSGRYYDSYFIFDTPDDTIPPEDIEIITQNIIKENENELTRLFESYISQYGSQEFRDVLDIICRQHWINHLTPENICKVCIAISLLKENQERKYYTEPDRIAWNMVILNLLNLYTRIIINNSYVYKDTDLILETIQTIINTAEVLFSVSVAVTFKRDSLLKYDKTQEINKICYQVSQRYMKEKSVKDFFKLGKLYLEALFSAWKGYDETEYRSFIKEKISSPDIDVLYMTNSFIAYNSPNSCEEFRTLFDREIDTIYDRVKNDIGKQKEFDQTSSARYFITVYEQWKIRVSKELA